MGAYGSPELYPRDEGDRANKHQSEKLVIYKKWWFWVIAIICILLFVAGGADMGSACILGVFGSLLGLAFNVIIIIIRLIKKQNFKSELRRIGAFLVIFITSVATVPKTLKVEKATNNTQDMIINEEEYKEKTVESDIDQQNNVTELTNAEPAVEYEDTDYIDMWNNYTDDEYRNKPVRIIGKIYNVGKRDIIINNGLSGVTGNIMIALGEDIPTDVEKDKYITVKGIVRDKVAGYLYLKDCIVESVSDEAPIQITEYEKIRTQKEEDKITKYKTEAEVIQYEDIVRNPDDYIGHVIYVDLNVSQVLVGGALTESGYYGKEGNDEWYVHYELEEGESRILEDDKVRFYGEFTGLAEMKRALTGTKVLIPRLDAKYRD